MGLLWFNTWSLSHRLPRKDRVARRVPCAEPQGWVRKAHTTMYTTEPSLIEPQPECHEREWSPESGYDPAPAVDWFHEEQIALDDMFSAIDARDEVAYKVAVERVLLAVRRQGEEIPF